MPIGGDQTSPPSSSPETFFKKDPLKRRVFCLARPLRQRLREAAGGPMLVTDGLRKAGRFIRPFLTTKNQSVSKRIGRAAPIRSVKDSIYI
jgi:hypothetical protein